MALHVRRRLTRWGNGFGIRITVREAKELGILPGQDVDAEIHPVPAQNDLAALPKFNLGGDYDIDSVIEEDLAEKYGGR